MAYPIILLLVIFLSFPMTAFAAVKLHQSAQQTYKIFDVDEILGGDEIYERRN